MGQLRLVGERIVAGTGALQGPEYGRRPRRLHLRREPSGADPDVARHHRLLRAPGPRIFDYNPGVGRAVGPCRRVPVFRRKFGWSAFVLLALAIEPSSSSAEESWEALKQARLTATGRVLLPDGSPAANAIVYADAGDLQCGVSSAITAESTRIRPIGGNRRGL
jgi:hypothetical protein